MKPKDKYPLIELKDKSLYDLIPGKIYSINIEILDVIDNYRSQRELWKTLNPNDIELNKLSPIQQRSFLDNRIGRYFNVVKTGGVNTELGNFYFCKHPSCSPHGGKKGMQPYYEGPLGNFYFANILIIYLVYVFTIILLPISIALVKTCYTRLTTAEALQVRSLSVFISTYFLL